MNPAFSVILFTTLSGAGYGLLAWVGIAIAMARPETLTLDDPDWSTWIARRCLVLLATGVALSAIGLASSTFHLGKPMRAWRAFSQWRTSWLSREGLVAMLAWLPALALIVWSWGASSGSVPNGWPGSTLRWLGGSLALLSIATVVCTAMIYACLKPIPAWRHALVAPVYVVFALFTGFLLLAAMMALEWNRTPDEPTWFVVLPRAAPAIAATVALVLAAMKFAYWRSIDRIALPTRESATALEGYGKVATFERPHTEANYLTREMGFVLARKHSRKLRIIAVSGFAVVPLLACAAIAWAPAMAGIALWIATLAALAGALVERWLFFAEARHMVMLYY
jgi:DMSO reductase anchor subunit